MDCHRCRAYFDDVVWGKADPSAVFDLVSEHLQACPSCAREWRSSILMSEALNSWPDEAPQVGYVSRFWTKVGLQQIPRRTLLLAGLRDVWVSWFKKPRLAWAGGFIVMLIGMGVLSLMPSRLITARRPSIEKKAVIQVAREGITKDKTTINRTVLSEQNRKDMEDFDAAAQDFIVAREEWETLDETLFEMLTMPDADWELLDDFDVLAAWDGEEDGGRDVF